MFKRKNNKNKTDTEKDNNIITSIDLMQDEFKVLINSFFLASKFSSKCSKYDADITISDGKFVLNAKSLLCVLSLDLMKWLTVKIHTDEKDVIHKFNKEMLQFRIG